MNKSTNAPTAVFVLGTKKNVVNIDDWVRWYKNEYHTLEFYHFKAYTFPDRRHRLLHNCKVRKGERDMSELLSKVDFDFTNLFMYSAPKVKRNYLIEGINKDQIQILTRGFKENNFDIRVIISTSPQHCLENGFPRGYGSCKRYFERPPDYIKEVRSTDLTRKSVYSFYSPNEVPNLLPSKHSKP